MAFADLLLRVVPGAPDERERLDVAVDLARRVHARLNGVFIQETDGKADWAHALFERAVGRSSLETSWRVVGGQGGASLLDLARRSDLVILPCADSGPAGRAPEQLALCSGRPLLILPPARPEVAVGARVVIGWNESREAARALHDALPILIEADTVLILTVLEPGPSEQEAPKSMGDVCLLDHLRQHGVAAELARLHGEDPAEEIAREVRRIDADMLVIGLHERAAAARRTPDRRPERTLGEISRRFVNTGSLPVFCSH